MNASYQWKWNKKEFHFCFISDVTLLSFSFSLVYKRKERLLQQHHSLAALSWDFKWNKVFDFQQKFLVSVWDSYFLISTMAKVRRIRFKSWQGLNMKLLGTMFHVNFDKFYRLPWKLWIVMLFRFQNVLILSNLKYLKSKINLSSFLCLDQLGACFSVLTALCKLQ